MKCKTNDYLFQDHVSVDLQLPILSGNSKNHHNLHDVNSLKAILVADRLYRDLYYRILLVLLICFGI